MPFYSKTVRCAVREEEQCAVAHLKNTEHNKSGIKTCQASIPLADIVDAMPVLNHMKTCKAWNA